jgi:DNA-binding LacI/PurR family transcriptional regulator
VTAQGAPSRPVMADVATRAGVSVMTVSRVLNGFPGVADGTRSRVELAVAALGYHANTAARVLAGGRSRTLGVIGVETEQFGPSHILFGVEAAARAAGHFLSFATLSRTGKDMTSTLAHLRASHVEGVIVVAPIKPVIEAVGKIEADMPLVVVGGDPLRSAATVTIGQVEGARMATRHLLDLGHRTVHHVRGPKSWVDAAARMRGWTDALRIARAPRVAPLVGDWSARGGYSAGVRLAQDPDVTAVFAANDQTALGIMRALHEAGRNVPGDVSLVGFDDTPESSYYMPALTTIRQDFAEVGRRSVRLLLSLMDGDPADPHIVVPARMVLRNSSAPPPVRSR